jgi:hypothetical protein
MSFIPRWMQFDVDPRKVLKKMAEENNARYCDDSQAAFAEVSDGKKEAGKVFWHSGRNYLVGIFSDEYSDDIASIVAYMYSLEKLEEKISPDTTLRQLAFSLKGLKTEDFEKAVKGADRLYRAISQYSKLTEELNPDRRGDKHGNSPSDAA